MEEADKSSQEFLESPATGQRRVPTPDAISRAYIRVVSYSLISLSALVAGVSVLIAYGVEAADSHSLAALLCILGGCLYAFLMGFIARKRTIAAAKSSGR